MKARALVVLGCTVLACDRFNSAYDAVFDGGAGGASPPPVGGAQGTGGRGGATACDTSTTGIGLGSDPLHCGACGRKCEGACDAGRCVPRVFGVDGGTLFHGFAVTNDTLFVGESDFNSMQNSIYAVSLDGGAASRIVESLGPQQDVLVVNDALFATQWLPSKVALGRAIADRQTMLQDLAGDGDQSFFMLERLPRGALAVANGSKSFLAFFEWPTRGNAASDAGFLKTELGVSSATGIATCGESTFVTSQSVDGVVLEVKGATRPDASVRRLPADRPLNQPWGVACNDDWVFVTTFGGGELWRFGRTGGEPQKLASGLNGPRGILLDGPFVYVTEFSEAPLALSDGGLLANRLLRFDINGTGQTTLATHRGGVFVRRFGDFIYWTSHLDARILRIPRY